MTTDPHTAPNVPTPDEEIWSDDAERRYELGLINAEQARQASGIPTESIVGKAVSGHAVRLELVDEDHVPEPTAKCEATLRSPRKPRTWRENLVADQPPESQRVTPHGHDYIPTVIDGVQVDQR